MTIVEQTRIIILIRIIIIGDNRNASRRKGGKDGKHDDYKNGALEEIETEITTSTEFAEVKAEEEKEEARLEETYRKEEENYNKAIRNGLCPKCRTYCYGDCD